MKPEDHPNFVKRDECPSCFTLLECATSIHNPSLKAHQGDITVCAKCQTFLTYDSAMNLVLLDEDGFAALTPENQQDLLTTRLLLKAANLSRGHQSTRPDDGFRRTD